MKTQQYTQASEGFLGSVDFVPCPLDSPTMTLHADTLKHTAAHTSILQPEAL